MSDNGNDRVDGRGGSRVWVALSAVLAIVAVATTVMYLRTRGQSDSGERARSLEKELEEARGEREALLKRVRDAESAAEQAREEARAAREALAKKDDTAPVPADTRPCPDGGDDLAAARAAALRAQQEARAALEAARRARAEAEAAARAARLENDQCQKALALARKRSAECERKLQQVIRDKLR